MKTRKKKGTKNNIPNWSNIYSYDNYITSIKRLILESPENEKKEKPD
jgi:hypothetical protein